MVLKMVELRSETKRRQDKIRETGKAAGRTGASKRVIEHLKDKECLSEDERDVFDEGVREGQSE